MHFIFCAIWNFNGKIIYFFIFDIQNSDGQDNEHVTTNLTGRGLPSQLVTGISFSLSLVYTH
jgi:hypothetical protein